MQTLSRHRISLLRQGKLEVEVNVLATKTTIVVTESEEDDKKIVATQKRILRHNNELKADNFVAIKEIYVATIKAAKSEISVTIEKFYVATKKKREVR